MLHLYSVKIQFISSTVFCHGICCHLMIPTLLHPQTDDTPQKEKVLHSINYCWRSTATNAPSTLKNNFGICFLINKMHIVSCWMGCSVKYESSMSTNWHRFNTSKVFQSLPRFHNLRAISQL